MPAKSDPATLKPRSRAAWRAWLAKHHASSPGLWVAIAKQASGGRGVAYTAAVEEALCFGWIDSRTRSLDAEHFLQWFSPRKPRSVWSPINKQRVSRLIEQGLMTPAGLAKIEAAQADGSWSSYDTAERLEVPADLQQALAANPTARQHFGAFSPSSRKMILWWIASAKRAETRRKRVAETVRLAAQNLRANLDREP
jgi:uncharacterized protein YdeI (YjbR/CyaY-like superfamily)